MTHIPATPPPEADACARTPSMARALLAVLLAPFLALIESRIVAIIARLEDMLAQWRDGTLLPLPAPESAPRTPRTRTPRTTPAPDESWFASLVALALSDQPRPRRRRRAPAADPAPQRPPAPTRQARPQARTPRKRPARIPFHAPSRAQAPPDFSNGSLGPSPTHAYFVT